MKEPVKCICGHKPSLHRARGRVRYLYIACFKCGRRTAQYQQEEAVIDAWNDQIDEEKHQLFG